VDDSRLNEGWLWRDGQSHTRTLGVYHLLEEEQQLIAAGKLIQSLNLDFRWELFLRRKEVLSTEN
jgi:hypothetical protein